MSLKKNVKTRVQNQSLSNGEALSAQAKKLASLVDICPRMNASDCFEWQDLDRVEQAMDMLMGESDFGMDGLSYKTDW